MTLIYELCVDILKVYIRTKMKFLSQFFEQLEPEQDRETDRRDWTHYQAAFAGCNEVSPVGYLYMITCTPLMSKCAKML